MVRRCVQMVEWFARSASQDALTLGILPFFISRFRFFPPVDNDNILFLSRAAGEEEDSIYRMCSWQCQRDKESRQECDGKNDQINEPSQKEFEHGNEPALPINAADRQENLAGESQPEKSNNPAG